MEAVYVKKKDTTTAKLYMKYTYDANGNTIERIAYTDTGEVKTTFEYDTLNRVVKTIAGGKVTEYLYDNAGNRFIKKGPEGTTLYLRHGQTSVAMDIELGQTGIKGKINRYVLSGELLAGRITKTVKIDGSMSYDFSYYHLDHLNSTKCVSDEAGVVEVRYVYRAFGSQLAKIGSGEAKYTYSGKELDGETNLYYFNARYYDAEIGRFISVDPAKDGLNWYVFCNNNPLSFKDPTGLMRTEIINQRFEIKGTMDFTQAMKFTSSFISSDQNKPIVDQGISKAVGQVNKFFKGVGDIFNLIKTANKIEKVQAAEGAKKLQDFLSSPDNAMKIISGEYSINTLTQYAKTIINTYISDGRGGEILSNSNTTSSYGETLIYIVGSDGKKVIEPIIINYTGANNVIRNSTEIQRKHLGTTERI